MSQVAQPGTNANPVNIGEVSNTPLPESPSTAQLGILGNIFGVGSAVTNGALSSLDVYTDDAATDDGWPNGKPCPGTPAP